MTCAKLWHNWITGIWIRAKNVFITLLRADTFVKGILEHRCSWRSSNHVGLLIRHWIWSSRPLESECSAFYSICVSSPHFIDITRSACTNRRATNWHDAPKTNIWTFKSAVMKMGCVYLSHLHPGRNYSHLEVKFSWTYYWVINRREVILNRFQNIKRGLTKLSCLQS